MAVRREVVTLSQLLQRRSAGNDRDRTAPSRVAARPATPLVARLSAGSGASGSTRGQPVTRPPPMSSLAASKPPVQRVRGTHDAHQAQSQHEFSCHSQSAQSVYSFSQDEDSYVSLSQPQPQPQPQYPHSQSQSQYSQPQYSQPPLAPQSQSQTYYTPSQEEPRGLHARCATPTVQQSKYFQMLRKPAQTPHKTAEQSELLDDKVEKLLDPIKKGVNDIKSALERQQDERRRQQNDSAEVKERVESLSSAVDKLWRQHRESESEQAGARTQEATKVASALGEVQHSLRKVQDGMAAFTDLVSRFEQERATNRAVLAAMAGITPPSPQLRLRQSTKRKVSSPPGLPRKRSRQPPAIAPSGWDSVESSQSCSDVIWVDDDCTQSGSTSHLTGVGADGLKKALKKLRDARTRHQRC